MNKKLRFILCVGVFLITLCTYYSCKESDLNLKPAGLTEDTYLTNQDEIETAVRGIYSKFTDFYYYAAGNWEHAIWILPGDDITTTELNAEEVFGTLNSGDGSNNAFFTTCYNVIQRSNVVLEKIEEIKYSDQELKAKHKGEALFLRSWVNFNLWNYYGTAPLVLKRAVTKDQLYVGNSKDTELLDQAITDLKASVDLLPTTWPDAFRGRVTKNSALGLLGKALVFRGTVKKNSADFQSAIDDFNNISGLSLTSNFEDNFAYDTENNQESLFEFQASRSITDNVWLANDFTPDDRTTGAMSAYWGFYNNNFSLFGRPIFTATSKLMTALDSLDPRKKFTYGDGGKIRKYVFRDSVNGNGVGSLNNPRLLRYADILLLKAEAILGVNGSTSEAIMLINQIRARARNMVTGGLTPADYDVNETDKTKIMDWIMNERFIELAGEGQRWIDLRRWSLGGMITLTNEFFSSNSPTINFKPEKNLNFPLPVSELNLNSKVVQNPGY